MPTTVAVLLAGGTGTRLYPASRPDRPKQFLSLDGDRSLLRAAADRVAFADAVYAVTGERYADRVADEVPEATVLAEPEPRDTGPALAYAAHRVRADHPHATLLCTPTDAHVAGDFATVGSRAVRAARETGGLALVGVEPDRPATGYGYVEPDADPGDSWARVVAFREKPDAARARRLVDRGCLWNAGVVACAPDAFLDAARDSPLAPLVEALDRGDPVGGFGRVDPVSVDYAVLERADDVVVVRADVEWDDLGTWDAFRRVLGDGSDANVTVGDGESLTLDARGNVVASDGAHVSVVGVDDLVVAAYDDRVLVVPIDQSQRVREVVERVDRDAADQ